MSEKVSIDEVCEARRRARNHAERTRHPEQFMRWYERYFALVDLHPVVRESDPHPTDPAEEAALIEALAATRTLIARQHAENCGCRACVILRVEEVKASLAAYGCTA